MKKLGLTIAAGVLACAATTAGAQSFTYDIVWQPVESIGGVTGPEGRQYGGGVVSGTYASTYADGSVNRGNVKCVGMGQPDGGVFAIHITCSGESTDGEGGKFTTVYGCNYIGKPGPETPLGCVGRIEGKEGEFSGRNGGLTMEWYSDSQARGTGQWNGGG